MRAMVWGETPEQAVDFLDSASQMPSVPGSSPQVMKTMAHFMSDTYHVLTFYDGFQFSRRLWSCQDRELLSV